MKLTFPNKTEFETDTIIDFLNQEGIKYKTKLVRSGIVDIYDIYVDTTYEHFMFVNKLAYDKLEPYFIAMRSFLLPSYEPKKHNTDSSGFTLHQEEIPCFKVSVPNIEIVEYKPKKQSLLYKIMKWMEK